MRKVPNMNVVVTLASGQKKVFANCTYVIWPNGDLIVRHNLTQREYFFLPAHFKRVETAGELAGEITARPYNIIAKS